MLQDPIVFLRGFHLYIYTYIYIYIYWETGGCGQSFGGQKQKSGGCAQGPSINHTGSFGPVAVLFWLFCFAFAFGVAFLHHRDTQGHRGHWCLSDNKIVEMHVFTPLVFHVVLNPKAQGNIFINTT